MTAELVSVVLPTLGRIERLERALESIASQTYTTYEVIVVDGNSSEDVKKFLAEFPEHYQYRQQSGTGLSNARNIGIRAAEGDYIAFLDDDDQWYPEKLSRQVEVMRSAPTTSAFVYTGIKSVNSEGELIRIKHPTTVPTIDQLLTRNYVGAPSSVLVRRECLEKVGCFDESLPSREEWDLYIRLCSRYDTEVISSPLVIKEKHPGSMSADVELIKRDWKALYQKHKEKYTQGISKKFWANYHLVLCRKYADQSEIAQARRHAFRSLQYRFDMGTLPYLFGTCLGETGYNMLRQVRRQVRKFSQ